MLGLGFQVVDVSVNFSAKCNKIQCGNEVDNIRFARPDDKNSVFKLASENFKFTRFHNDPNIPNKIANKIKGNWTTNFFEGNRGNEMIVAEESQNIVGFLLLIYKKDSLIIDLIAVSKRYLRKGIAFKMVTFLLTNQKFSFHPEHLIKVGTQISNISSLNFYKKIGFEIQSTNLVLHKNSLLQGLKF